MRVRNRRPSATGQITAPVRGVREAPTIVLIGAGSASFGLTTLHDLYADPVFTGATVRLVDLDPAPLERMSQLAAALEAATGRGITVERYTRTGRRAAGRGRRRRVGRGRSRQPLAARLRDPAPARRRPHLRRERRTGRPLARAAHDPARRRRSRATSSGSPPTRCSSTSPTPRAGSARRSGGTSTSPIIGLCHEVKIANDRFSRLLGRRIESRAAGPQPLHVPARGLGPRDRRRRHAAAARRGRRSRRRRRRDVRVREASPRPFRRDRRDERQPRGRVLPELRPSTPQPLDIAARQHAMRSMIDEVVDAILAGTFDLGAVPAVGDRRRVASDPARRDLGRVRNASRRRSCPTTTSCRRSPATARSR